MRRNIFRRLSGANNTSFNSCIERGGKEETKRRMLEYADDVDDAANNTICVKSNWYKGFTLLEMVIALIIFCIAVLSAVTIFRNSLYRFGRQSAEKKIYSEASRTFGYIEKYLPSAMCNDMKGGMRINFKGEKERVRFVSPFSEGPESDLAKFGIYFDSAAGAVKVAVERIDRASPDFRFSEGFPGAQVAGEGISAFALSYSGGSSWKDEWNTEDMEDPVLPRLVKIELTCFSGKIEGVRDEKTFTKIIRID